MSPEREPMPEPIAWGDVAARLADFERISWLIATDASRIAEQLEAEGWEFEAVCGVLAGYRGYLVELVEDAIQAGYALRRQS